MSYELTIVSILSRVWNKSGVPVLISVIIPFYNEIALINRAVTSVGAQLNKGGSISYEILICNDGDLGASEILEAIDPLRRAGVVIVKNLGPKGPGGARNSGLARAQGELVAFLDADDFWLPGKIESQLQMLESGATFVVTAYQLEDSKVVVKPPKNLSSAMDVFRCLGIGTSTVLVKRSLCQDRRFREIRFAQDIDYWYALAQSPQFRFGAVSTSLVVYSQGGSTKNKWVQLKYFWKVLQLNQIGLRDKTMIMVNYIQRGIMNHYFSQYLRR